MSLPDFIESNIERLVDEWKEFAKGRLPAAAVMGAGALRNGAESILRAVAADMKAPQSDREQAERSRGQLPERAPALTDTARQHAADRLSAGFTLDQLVAEYRALRGNVMRHWTAEMRTADRQTLEDLARFTEAMDQSLSEAIKWFNDGLERSRNVFVGVLGHDLRNPLNAAMAATDLQLMTDNPDTQRRSTEKIRRNLHRMTNMINDLLDFTRTRLGERLPIEPRPGDLSEACHEILEAFELSDHGREVQLACTGDLTGTWDPDRIKQLLSNLVRNALEHGRDDTPVKLTAAGGGEDVVLSVHNHGPPIPRDKQHVIFDPLTRGDVGTTQNPRLPGNLGLGLYVVKQIAEAHGGTVELSSTAQSGTTFQVRLPRAPGNETAP